MAVESSDGEQTKRQNTLPDTVTSVTIPASITTIGAQAFAYSKIEKVTLEANSKLTEICAEAFYNTPITEFTLPESVKEVGNLAFGNTLLNKLTLNANLEPMEQTRGVYPTYLEEQQDGYYAYDDTLAVSGNQYYSLAWQVLDLVNQERAEQGLTALTMDKDFLSAAMQRAAETSISFSHNRPTEQDCFSISSKMTRENIALGSTTAEEVVNQCMNSAGHRENILSSDTKSLARPKRRVKDHKHQQRTSSR